MDSANTARHVFERAFSERPLELQISHCDHFCLLPWFKSWLPGNQPILEAGCGSGRWVIWFDKQGWEAVGLDWSEELIARSRSYHPAVRFEVGDMRAMPFGDNEFGAIVSLGAIEHTIEGPRQSLAEYFRVLRARGIAIITVPFLGSVRRITRLLKPLSNGIKNVNTVRKLFGKDSVDRTTLREIESRIMPGYAADLMIQNSKWGFYQYQFTKEQMRNCLTASGFIIEEEFVEHGDEGILHNFGRLAGKYDFSNARVDFTFLGKILRKTIPISEMGHMLCYVVRSSK